MSRTRIKICGITSPEDAALAAELGADAIGLNFVGGPRKIALSQAGAIVAAIGYEGYSEPVPKFHHAPTPVALCVAPDEPHGDEIWPTQVGLRITRFQIYGTDTQRILHAFASERDAFSLWLTARVASLEDVARVVDTIGATPWRVDAVVLDAAVPGYLGGTGRTFVWSWIERARDDRDFLHLMPPIILAGGLTPDNVATAIRIARPYAVDVSSGVEFPGQPGKKDPTRVRDFIQAVRSADDETGST